MKQFKKATSALMESMATFFVAGCKPENDFNDGGGNKSCGNTYNCHAYVDFGLPSGTLWATCNVGANAPWEYGDYFAWGETTPKTTYNWSNYKYCKGVSDQLTKYCNDLYSGYNGFTDNLTVLQSMDDAATANWGNGWRMPTRKQWDELYNWTTVQKAMQNGHSGLLFTGSNGEALFLPAAGDRWGDELRKVGSYGYYWSSSLYAIVPNGAWSFGFGSVDCIGCNGRCGGLSVRAMRSSGQD